MTRLSTFFGAVVTVVVTSTGAAFAQPNISSPVNGQVFRAGPDYATDVLHDPWDFDNVEDVAPHPDDYLNWVESGEARSVGASRFLSPAPGRFTARSSTNDPMLGLLYQGDANALTIGRTGLRYPIDTTRYRKLAFRMKAANVPSGGSQSHVTWFFGPKPFSAATMGTAVSPTFTTDGERIYQIDLVGNFAHNAHYDSLSRAVGLRLDPTSDIGATIEIDWVRLTTSDGAPGWASMPVQFSGCTAPYTVNVVADVDNFAQTVFSGTGSPGTFNQPFNYGILPPGSYTLRVACANGTASRPFTINEPPRVAVTRPSELGSTDDYATSVLGNAWDFADAADVPAATNVQLLSATPGVVHARSVPPAQRDPQLFLLNGERGREPIASSRYRYLTFSLGLDFPFTLSQTDGSMARVFWASRPNFDGNVATVTKDVIVWPGQNTYTIDLARLSQATGTLEPCLASQECLPWTARSPRFVRIDPHEIATSQVNFHLGSVRLTAADEVRQVEVFQVQWAASQFGPGSTANIYYDTDTDASSPPVPIEIGVPAGIGSVNWVVPPTLTPGEYFIYVEIVEPVASTPPSIEKRGTYSTGVVRVIGATNQPVVTIATHTSGATTHSPYTIAGCAYNGAPGGAADEVIVYAHPLQGQMGGVVQLLGHNAPGGLGTLALLPSPSAWCAGPGYQVTNIFGLSPGLWTFRVLARNTISGDFDEVQAQNVMVEHRSAAPRNLRLVSVVGNTVSIAWDPPGQGMPLTHYRIEAAGDPSFAGASPIVLPPHVTSATGTIGNGTYYIRVVAANNYSVSGIPSNVISFRLPGGGVVPGPPPVPGPPTLVATQVAANPIVLSWAPGQGGAPSAYTLFAGTAPGASNLGVFPMGSATSVSAMAPAGRIYVRVIASNAGGNAISNEIDFAIMPPPAPTMNPPAVRGRDVTLSWTTAPGIPATRYVVLARYPGQNAVLVSLPTTQASVFVPNAPPGTYIVTVVAINGAGASAESNQVTVPVP